MKKCLFGLLVPALALAAAGCSREPAGEGEKAPVGQLKLAASIEDVQDADATKVDISSASGAFTWTAGDKIAVHTSIPYYMTATLESGAGTASGVFTAEMDDDTRDGYAVYPASVAGGTAAAPTVTLPSEYTIDGSMEEYSPLPMIAVNTPGNALSFKHVGAIFRITLEDVPAGTKYINVTTDLDIYGTFTVQNPSTASPTIQTSSAANSRNVVKFTLSSALSQKQTLVLNLPLPVCDGTVYSTLSVDVYNESDELLAGAGNDNVRAMTRGTGRKISMTIVPNSERIGSFTITDQKVKIGDRVNAGAWTTLTYSAYDMSTTPVAITDATITCVNNSNSDAVNWQTVESGGETQIQVQAAAGAAAGEVATLTFRMVYCNDYKTATVTVTTMDRPDGYAGPFTLGGTEYYLSQGNMYKTSTGYALYTNPFEGISKYNNDTKGSKGTAPNNTTTGNVYFQWTHLATLFCSPSINTSANENINNGATPIADNYLPTSDQWAQMTTTKTRSGSNVNGTAAVHFVKVIIDLTGSAYASKGLSSNTGGGTDNSNVKTNYQAGLILFPDGATITSNYSFTASNYDNASVAYPTSLMTYSQLAGLLDEGCAFLPAAGRYNSSNSNWYNGGSNGYYWSATSLNTSSAYYLYFYGSSVNPSSSNTKSNYWFPVRLLQE